MRSGLQKPGAIPLLALLVFALLSLVPTVSKGWEGYTLRPRRLSYYSNDFSHYCLAEDGSLFDAEFCLQATCDAAPGSNAPGGLHCVSQDAAALSTNLKSHIAEITISERTDLSTLKTAQLSKGRSVEESAYGATAFSGKLNALRMLVSREGRDNRLVRLLAGRNSHPPAEKSVARPSSTTVDSDHPVLILHTPGYQTLDSRTVHGPNHTDTSDGSTLKLPFGLRETWQQVCKLGIGALESSAFASAFDAWRRVLSKGEVSILHGESSQEDQLPAGPPSESHEARVQPSTQNSTAILRSQPSVTHFFDVLTLTPPPSTTPAEQQNVAGVTTNPKEMRGSCMAIVIGLIVGIMWF